MTIAKQGSVEEQCDGSNHQPKTRNHEQRKDEKEKKRCERNMIQHRHRKEIVLGARKFPLFRIYRRPSQLTEVE